MTSGCNFRGSCGGLAGVFFALVDGGRGSAFFWGLGPPLSAMVSSADDLGDGCMGGLAGGRLFCLDGGDVEGQIAGDGTAICHSLSSKLLPGGITGAGWIPAATLRGFHWRPCKVISGPAIGS